MFKKLLKFAFIWILFLFSTNTYSNYTEGDLELISSKLNEIDGWEIIRAKLDNFIETNKSNKTLLEEFDSKLSNAYLLLKTKKDRKSYILKLIIFYVKINISFALEDIRVEEQALAEQKQENLDNNQDETSTWGVSDDTTNVDNITETWVYTGFTETYNDQEKTILAGTQAFIYAGWIWSLYEQADVWKTMFYITWSNASDLQYVIDKAYLYVEGLNVAEANYGDISVISSTKVRITFDNINNFIIPDDENIDFRLAIKTNKIWYQKIGKIIKDFIVSDVDFDNVIWLTSDKEITNIDVTDFSSEKFSVSAWVVTVSAVNTLDDSYTIKLNVKTDFWSNTKNSDNWDPSLEMSKLRFSVFGTDASSAVYSLYNNDNSSDIITWTYNSWIVEFDLSLLEQKSKNVWEWRGEDFIIKITWITSWLSMKLLRDGVIYDIVWISNWDNINANLKDSIDFWYRDF